MHLMLTSKKGISSLQVMRYMGFGSYNTALMMCNKIRVALGKTDFKKLVGVVEVDETFIGGKAKNKHKDKRGGRGGTGGGGPRGGIGSGKAVVAGAVQRKGNVVARVVEGIDGPSLRGFIRETVSNKVSLICTDAWRSYRGLHWEYPHGIVDHRKGEYVIGAIHTNTIEGFWSLVKRGIVGTFHKVSHRYLPLYVNEFEFRYNNRNNPDIFGTAIQAC
jgi:transposase-like protein